MVLLVMLHPTQALEPPANLARFTPREFTQSEKEEQEIAEACNRPIRNSIIRWNYLSLARGAG